MKIFAIGWNYALHNAEMQRSDIPEHPTLFLKPDSALLKDGKPLFLPDFSDQIEYEGELVFRISRVGKHIESRFASRYYDAVTVGVDFTARDLQAQLRAAGAPWEISKGFDGAAAIGEFMPLEELADPSRISFSLQLNGELRQEASSTDMLFGVNELIAYISRFYTLKIGDLLYTGTPAGVGKVSIDDHISGFIGEKKLLDFYVR